MKSDPTGLNHIAAMARQVTACTIEMCSKCEIEQKVEYGMCQKCLEHEPYEALFKSGFTSVLNK